MVDNIQAVLRKTPLFASLTEEETRALARRTSKKRLQLGDLLFGEGDPCTGLFLVASGEDGHLQAVGVGTRTSVGD